MGVAEGAVFGFEEDGAAFPVLAGAGAGVGVALAAVVGVGVAGTGGGTRFGFRI